MREVKVLDIVEKGMRWEGLGHIRVREGEGGRRRSGVWERGKEER